MKTIKIFLILLLSTMLLNSCKNYEEDIIGTWNFQTFDNAAQGTVTWSFKDDGLLIRVSTANSGIQFDSCNYTIENSFFKKQLTITGSTSLTGLPDLNGEYRIEKFKEDILIMTRTHLANGETAGAYYRCELKRKQ